MIITWSDTDNVLGTDFNLYSSLDNMKTDTNAYTFCSYNVVGRGFPLNCGPTGAIDSPAGWNSETEAGGVQNYAYRILKPNKK